jgi:serine/threonine protein kinase
MAASSRSEPWDAHTVQEPALETYSYTTEFEDFTYGHDIQPDVELPTTDSGIELMQSSNPTLDQNDSFAHAQRLRSSVIRALFPWDQNPVFQGEESLFMWYLSMANQNATSPHDRILAPWVSILDQPISFIRNWFEGRAPILVAAAGRALIEPVQSHGGISNDAVPNSRIGRKQHRRSADRLGREPNIRNTSSRKHISPKTKRKKAHRHHSQDAISQMKSKRHVAQTRDAPIASSISRKERKLMRRRAKTYLKETDCKSKRKANDGKQKGAPKYCCARQCGFTCQYPCELKKHDEINQPQEIYVCIVCVQHNGPKLYATHRDASLRGHIKRRHHSFQEIFVEKSLTDVQGKINDCEICEREGNSTKKFQSLEERHKHILTHAYEDATENEDSNTDDSDDDDDNDDDNNNDNRNNHFHNGNGNDNYDDKSSNSGSEEDDSSNYSNEGSTTGPSPVSWPQNDENGSNNWAISGLSNNFKFDLIASQNKIGNPYMIEKVKVIGMGSHTIVEQVKHLASSKVHARKMTRVKQSNTPTLSRIKTEIQILQALHHRHIVRFVMEYRDADSFGFLLNPAGDYSLRHFLERRHRQPADTAAMVHWFGCLASAVAYLQSKDVRHRDIKPENIIIKDTQVFLTDFGISEISRERRLLRAGESQPGTPMYTAPEVAEHHERSHKADVFSLGCVYVEMVTVLATGSVAGIKNKLKGFPNHPNAQLSQCQPYYMRIPSVINWVASLSSTTVSRELPPDALYLLCETITFMMEPAPSKRPFADELVSRMPFENFCKNCLSTSSSYLHKAGTVYVIKGISFPSQITSLKYCSPLCQSTETIASTSNNSTFNPGSTKNPLVDFSSETQNIENLLKVSKWSHDKVMAKYIAYLKKCAILEELNQNSWSLADKPDTTMESATWGDLAVKPEYRTSGSHDDPLVHVTFSDFMKRQRSLQHIYSEIDVRSGFSVKRNEFPWWSLSSEDLMFFIWCSTQGTAIWL